MTSRLIDLAARLEALARSRRIQAVVLLILVAYGVNHVRRGMGDFKVYRQAASRAVAGESMYRLNDPHRYLYAPVVTFLFFPLALLPVLAGKILWFAANVWMRVSIFRSTAVLILPGGRAPPGLHLLVLALSLRFLDNNIGHGQINIFLLWLVLEAYVLAGRGLFTLAGLALAAAIATKIFPGILMLQLVLRRQWRFAFATIAGFALLMAVPLLWWGGSYPQLLRDWVAVVADQAGHYELGNKINQSISAFVYRLFRPYPGGVPLVELPPAVVVAMTLAIHAAFLAPLVRLSLRLGAAPQPQGPGGDELALYLLYSTVLSPYSWKYYFVNLVFPLAAAVRRLWMDHRRSFEMGLWAVFFLNLLPGLELVGKRLATVLQFGSFHFLAVVVLFALLAREAFRNLRRGTVTRGRPAFTDSGAVC